MKAQKDSDIDENNNSNTGLKVNKETGEVYEGNNRFLQFYKHNFKLIRKLINSKPKAAELFFFLVENMDNRNAIVVSQSALQEVLGVGRTTIHKHINYLKELKIISIYKSGLTNVYAINADIVWQKRHDEKVFARFDAKVYLSKNEQDDDAPTIEKEMINSVRIVQQTNIYDQIKRDLHKK